MGRILETWRVPLAALFSAVLIIAAYVLAHGIESPPLAQASEETALLQAIATKDSTGDGLPDWEKSLYGIPLTSTTTDYFHLGMTDGEAVAKGLIVPKAIADISVSTTATKNPDVSSVDSSLPAPAPDGSITAAFAKNFFTLFLQAKQANNGADLSDTDMQNIANEALSSLSSAIVPAPDFKSANDLRVSGSGPDAMKQFAIDAEAVLLKNTSNATTSEINYLKYAVQGGDTSAVAHITSIAKAYRDSAFGLSMLSVPTELASTDLQLINALMRVSQSDDDFARVSSDPLATILALQQYPTAVAALGSAFVNLGTVYSDAGITFAKGAPGASFVNLVSAIAAKKASAIKP